MTVPSFIEIQLPTAVSIEAKGGPGFLTSVVMAQSGYEQRNVNWSQARAKYDVGFVNKNAAYKDRLIAFHRNVYGKATGFRFKDHADYQVTAQVIGTGTGASQNIQLFKSYAMGGYTYQRTIRKPVTAEVKDDQGTNLANTFHIYYNGSEQSAGGSPPIWSLDYTTGIVTCHPSGGVVITASFDFDVPVRFDTDDQQISEHGGGVYSWPSIPLIEVRV